MTRNLAEDVVARRPARPGPTRIGGATPRSLGPHRLTAAAVALTSLLLSLWYCATQFVPYLLVFETWDSYDAFRYHHAAAMLSRSSLADVFSADLPFQASAYPRLLALVYYFTGPSPYWGCVLNWCCWTAAGALVVPVAVEAFGEASARGRGSDLGLAFFALWALLPETFDWCGTTSKEPLAALLLAAGLRSAMGIAKSRSRWQVIAWTIGVALIAWAGYEVRNAQAPATAAGVLAAIELRGRRRTPWVASTAIAVGLLSLYALSGLGSELTGDSVLNEAGYSRLQSDQFASNLSASSVLLQLSSANRYLDAIAAPLRGIGHIIVPLNILPTNLPFAAVAQDSLLIWLSAVVYAGAAPAIALGAWDRVRGIGPASPIRGMLSGQTAVVFVVLGLSGVIHERYRSMLTVAYFPLAFAEWRRELDAHGARRVVVFGTVAALLCVAAYAALKLGAVS